MVGGFGDEGSTARRGAWRARVRRELKYGRAQRVRGAALRAAAPFPPVPSHAGCVPMCFARSPRSPHARARARRRARAPVRGAAPSGWRACNNGSCFGGRANACAAPLASRWRRAGPRRGAAGGGPGVGGGWSGGMWRGSERRQACERAGWLGGVRGVARRPGALARASVPHSRYLCAHALAHTGSLAHTHKPAPAHSQPPELSSPAQQQPSPSPA
jgi:hypothetical protein